ncbi:hypothetical protein AU197_17930 [Mycobacterium sp. IS-1590]|uniref:hypothetical protein n=1 Tax=Mycobacterium sp. IS-1590 TaxID=1772286 RepID=UPI000749485F|nr:hypothetical protein [Mycobacterium sp. IS-1590]KUI42005.1 hypothetical protein AU197_17930 [Mycobacterium sp. IS-1590]
MTEISALNCHVQQVPPSEALLTASTLGRVDYADAFDVTVEHPLERSAEEWMRLILEGAPLHTRIRLLSAWSAIGLKLRAPGSAGAILGWKIRDRGAGFVKVGANSRLGMPAELVLRRGNGGLLFATLVRHDNALVRALWASIETSHVQTVRSLLERARR